MGDWIRVCATDDIDEEDLIRWDHEGRTFADGVQRGTVRHRHGLHRA